MRGLYIHIPFCKSICTYCDFPKIMSNDKEYYKYIDYLIDEIEKKKELFHGITSVYIGGGTPNALPIHLLEKLFMSIKSYLLPDNENTIEINPELLTFEQALLFTKYNINRVSMGVQTLNDEIIKEINRKHNKDIVSKAYKTLILSGIKNINIDLMFGIPNQTMEIIKNDLDYVMDLGPNHISYYSLIEEEKTVLDYLLRNKKIELLDDDLIADMDEYIKKYLINHGYHHYEVSNYAALGYESKHNMLYWTEEEYIGVGCGASSFVNHKRFTNARILSRYYNGELVDEENIDIITEKKEFMMLGLRMTSGVSLKKYKEKYGDVYTDFPIKELINKGLLIEENDYLRIPEDKFFVANLVFEEFI